MLLEQNNALKIEAFEILNKYYRNGNYIYSPDVLRKTMFPELVELMGKHIEAAAFTGAISSYALRRVKLDQTIYFDNPHKGAIARFFTGRGTVRADSHQKLRVMYDLALRQNVDLPLRTMVACYVFQFLCQEQAPVSVVEILALSNATSWSTINYAKEVLTTFSDLR